jgi:hypothetical protein
MGLLTKTGPPSWHPAAASIKQSNILHLKLKLKLKFSLIVLSSLVSGHKEGLKSYWIWLICIVCRKAAEFCNNHNIDIAQLSLSFAVNHLNEVATTLVGIQNTTQLISNVNALSMKIDPKVLHELTKILQPICNKTWISGRRENNGNIDS